MIAEEMGVFLAYRRSDGAEIARVIVDQLHGRSFSAEKAIAISVYHDLSVAAREDWRAQHRASMETSMAMIVVCSPDGTNKHDSDDSFHAELEWWISNRPQFPPILVSHESSTTNIVPHCIRSIWPNSQLVQINPTWNRRRSTDAAYLLERSIQTIISTLTLRARRPPHYISSSSRFSAPSLYHWEKDRTLRYIACCENYAAAAGLDSPHSIVGKMDSDLPWRSLAEFFQSGDREVMAGVGGPRVNVLEKELMADRQADILVTETELRDHRGSCIGVQGYFIDVTGAQLIRTPTPATSALPKELGDLTPEELEALGAILCNAVNGTQKRSIMPTAKLRAYTSELCRKLQCRSIAEIVRLCFALGIDPASWYLKRNITDIPDRHSTH